MSTEKRIRNDRNQPALATYHDNGTVTVRLLTDWRGMNESVLGLWRLPLDSATRVWLEDLGIDPEDVDPAERACGTCGEREGSTYAKRCCTSDNMVEL